MEANRSVRFSFSWAEMPKDLDLYDYRLNDRNRNIIKGRLHSVTSSLLAFATRNISYRVQRKYNFNIISSKYIYKNLTDDDDMIHSAL